jgi:hypothetical protein
MMLQRLGTLIVLSLLPGCVVVYRAPGTSANGHYHAVNTASYAVPAPGAPSRTYYRPSVGSAGASGSAAASSSAEASASATAYPALPAGPQTPSFDRTRPPDRYRPAPTVAPAPRGIVTPRPPPSAHRRPEIATKAPVVVRHDVVRPAPQPAAPEPRRQPGADAHRAMAFGLQAPTHGAGAGSPAPRLRPNRPSAAPTVDRTATKPASAQKAKKRRRRAKLK